MSEWKTYKFNKAVEVNPKVEIRKRQGLPFVEMKDVEPTNKFCTYSQLRDLSGGARFNNGDTLFARITPCLENGKIAQVRNLPDNVGFGSTEFHVLRGKKDITTSEFVYYLSRWDDVRDFAELNLHGTSGRQRFPAEAFGELEILLPPLPQQKSIAEVLSSLDDKIDLLHQQNKTLEALAETLFRQWFVEEADEQFETITIKEFATLFNGKSRPKEQNGEIPIYGGNGILGFTNQYNFSGTSIIIGRVGAYCGSLFYETKNIWVSDNALLLKVKDPLYTHYLFYLLRSLNLNSMAEGSSHPLLTQEIIYSLQTSLPSVEKITKFQLIVERFTNKIDHNKDQIQTLETLRNNLLPKLMSGAVTVSGQ